jgi:hypothetical protein
MSVFAQTLFTGAALGVGAVVVLFSIKRWVRRTLLRRQVDAQIDAAAKAALEPLIKRRKKRFFFLSS